MRSQNKHPRRLLLSAFHGSCRHDVSEPFWGTCCQGTKIWCGGCGLYKACQQPAALMVSLMRFLSGTDHAVLVSSTFQTQGWPLDRVCLHLLSGVPR